MSTLRSKASIRTRRYSAGAVTALAFAVGSPVMAQDFPTKPVRLIVPTAPGGNADIVARLTAGGMAKGLGQAMVVENRPGGRQIPASNFVARATPDGYTLLAVGLAFSVNAGLYTDLPFDSIKDFTPVGLVGSVPLTLVAHPGVPANSMPELIALAKAKPGTLHYASAGIGSPAHLGGELLNTLAGIKLVHVPYKATAQGNTDTMSGVVQLAFPATSSVVKLVAGGKLKALGIGSTKPSPLLPNVRPISETVPGYAVQLFNGIVAPAGTPREAVTRLNDAMVKGLAMPEVRDKLVASGLDLDPGTPQEFGDFLQGEIRKWAKVVKQAGIKSQR